MDMKAQSNPRTTTKLPCSSSCHYCEKFETTEQNSFIIHDGKESYHLTTIKILATILQLDPQSLGLCMKNMLTHIDLLPCCSV